MVVFAEYCPLPPLQFPSLGSPLRCLGGLSAARSLISQTDGIVLECLISIVLLHVIQEVFMIKAIIGLAASSAGSSPSSLTCRGPSSQRYVQLSMWPGGAAIGKCAASVRKCSPNSSRTRCHAGEPGGDSCPY